MYDSDRMLCIGIDHACLSFALSLSLDEETKGKGRKWMRGEREKKKEKREEQIGEKVSQWRE